MTKMARCVHSPGDMRRKLHQQSHFLGRAMESSTVVNNQKPGKDKGARKPVRIDAWLAANQPHLHPTRRKVLLAVADLTSEAQEATSSQVRQEVGISQQLLNRHLRGLEKDGLVELNKPGPGLPLNVRITPAGMRALGLRGPTLAPAVPPRPEAEPEPAPPAPRPQSRRERFLQELYQSLKPFLSGLDQEGFYATAARGLARGSHRGLLEALRPHLVGLDEAGFTVVLKHVLSRVTGRPVQVSLPVSGSKPAPAPVSTPDPHQPPALGPAEKALEAKLAQRVHPDYRGLAWYQRTREFSNEWDRIRRRRLGLLVTTFDSFSPRWEREDWYDFNLGRRQADARGASYIDWIEAQFLRKEGQDVSPPELHGEEAIAAYHDYRGGDSDQGAKPGPAPYTSDSFDPRDPDHVVYAQEQIAEITRLAKEVFGDDPQGPVQLLAQAVISGSLPRQALELTPRFKDKVLAFIEQQESRDQGQPHTPQPAQPGGVANLAPAPKFII